MTELKTSALGEKMRRIRYQRGWNQADLAERSGLSKSYINRLESGDAQPRQHQARTLFGLAQALDLPLEDLEL